MEQELNTNFFESVSRHNLERFHSECLCWLFNNNKKLTSEWVKEIISKKSTENNLEIEIDSIEVFTEVEQIDIVLIYKKKGNNEEYYGIIIENKVKANEHLIKLKKTNLLSNFQEGDELSQTEYYYYRNFATKEISNKNEKVILNLIDVVKPKTSGKKKNKNIKEKKYIDITKDKLKYIFLVPNKIQNIKDDLKELVKDQDFYDFEKLNIWNNEKTEFENPWETYTYIELANFLSNNIDKITDSVDLPGNNFFTKTYIDFLKKEFNKSVDLDNYNSNIYGKIEYMKFLRAAIYNKLNSECKELNKNGNVEAKSSKSGDPLFNIIISKDVFLEGFIINKFELGLQVQGITNKIYISAGKDYETTKFDKNQKNEYQKQVEKKLNDIIDKDNKKFKFLFSTKIGLLKENKNVTKTFYSFSFNFEDSKLSIEKKVYYLSDLVNQIYDIYNKTSFTSTLESNSKLSK